MAFRSETDESEESSRPTHDLVAELDRGCTEILAAKLDAFLQNTFLPAVPQQALDGGTLALADAIGVD